MSGRQISRRVIVCDGCGLALGENGEYAGAEQSRAAAALQGWVVVPRIRADGKPSSHGQDVCPDCQPTFKPAETSGRGRVPWHKARIAVLEAQVVALSQTNSINNRGSS